MIEPCNPLCIIDTATSNSIRALMTNILRIHFNTRQRIELGKRKTQITARGGHLDDTAGTSIVPIARLGIVNSTVYSYVHLHWRRQAQLWELAPIIARITYTRLSLRELALVKFAWRMSELIRCVVAARNKNAKCTKIASRKIASHTIWETEIFSESFRLWRNNAKWIKIVQITFSRNKSSYGHSNNVRHIQNRTYAEHPKTFSRAF